MMLIESRNASALSISSTFSTDPRNAIGAFHHFHETRGIVVAGL
jgi:hypothetical protein